MIISSVTNSKIKYLNSLNDNKGRKVNNEFIVEGKNLVYEAYKNNLLKEIYVLEDDIDIKDIPIYYVNRSIMKKLSNLTTPPNIIGLCKKKEETDNIGKRLLLLDNIQDPGNLGTIIRTSKAFNIDTIVLGNSTVSEYNSKVLRATQGIGFYINIIHRDLKEYISYLKDNDIKVYGTNVRDGVDVKTLKKEEKEKFALIMGSEGQGVNKDILKLCDKYIYIKLNEDVESLNVSVATAIILYELNRG